MCFSSLKAQLPSFKNKNPDSLYVFYTQIDQEITIALNGADVSKMEIKLQEGFANKLNDSTFSIRFNANMDESKIKLYYKNFPVDIMNVTSKSVAINDIILGGHVEKNLSVKELANIKKFELIYPKEFPLNLKPELFSCKLTIYQPGITDPFFTNVRNLDIPKNIQQLIVDLPKNSKISFEEIRIKTITNHVLNLENDPIVFTIVD